MPHSEALTAEKKVKGRKRHNVTDTQGHILHVKVHAANEHDTIAGCLVFEETLDKYPSLLSSVFVLTLDIEESSLIMFDSI